MNSLYYICNVNQTTMVMKNTIKYIAIHIELFILLLVFFLGVAIVDNGIDWLTLALLFGPFIFGKLVNINKQLKFCDVYERALNIKLKRGN